MRVRKYARIGAGWLASKTFAKHDFRDCIFIIAHMRCGSTALSNILCTRPEIAGYGETHVRYDLPSAMGRLSFNLYRRDAFDNKAAHLLDKILHSSLMSDVPEEFFQARAIFMLREPEASIVSIDRLYEKLDRPLFRGHKAAAEYYASRVQDLSEVWERFPADRRIGLTHAGLMRDPEGALDQISRHFGFTPPLENAYVSPKGSRTGGGGDPLVSGKYDRIVPDLKRTKGDLPQLTVAPELLAQARDSHAGMQRKIAAEWPNLV